MTDNNDWTDKPGVPLNPDWSGWHWVKREGCEPECFLWLVFYRGWRDDGSIIDAPQAADIFHYLGPVLTPAEVDARVKEARRDALEEAGAVAEDLIGRAYRIGFGEGMKEDRSFKGGIPWHDSATKKEGAAAIRVLAKGEGDE
jgi:hypothetical protein